MSTLSFKAIFVWWLLVSGVVATRSSFQKGGNDGHYITAPGEDPNSFLDVPDRPALSPLKSTATLAKEMSDIAFKGKLTDSRKKVSDTVSSLSDSQYNVRDDSEKAVNGTATNASSSRVALDSANDKDGVIESEIEQNDAEELGLNLIPGWSFVGVGYDASKSYGSYENTRRSIFRNVGSMLSSKFLGKVVPSHLLVMPIYVTKADTNVYMSREEAQESLAVRVSLSADANVFFGSFGMTADTNIANSAGSTTQSTLAQYEIASELYQLLLTPRSFEDAEEHFKRFVNETHQMIEAVQQTRKFESRSEAIDVNLELRHVYHLFHRFFQLYGTHVVTSAMMGGSLVLETSLSTEKKYTKEEISISASAYFKNSFVTMSASANTKKNKELDEKFESSSVRYRASGGDPKAARMISEQKSLESGFAMWLNTIKSHPSIVRFALKPIYELIPSTTFGSMHLVMKLALDMYLSGTPVTKNGVYHLPPNSVKFSSLTKLPTAGQGLIQFDATIHSSLTVILAVLPQQPLLRIFLSSTRSRYSIEWLDARGINKKSEFITNAFMVAQGISQTFWINIKDCKLHFGIGDLTLRKTIEDRQDFEFVDLWDHCEYMNRLQYVGFETDANAGVRLINLNIDHALAEAPKKAKRFETCALLKKEGKALTDGPTILTMSNGERIHVQCKHMDTPFPMEYIEIDDNFKSGSVWTPTDQVQKSFKLVRFVPKHMAIDLCDNSYLSSEPDELTLNDEKKIHVYPGVLQNCGAAVRSSANVNMLLKFTSIEQGIDISSNYDTGGNRINNPFMDDRLQCSLIKDTSYNTQISLSVDISRAEKSACGEIWYGDPLLGFKHHSDFVRCKPNVVIIPGNREKRVITFSEYKAIRIGSGTFTPMKKTITSNLYSGACSQQLLIRQVLLDTVFDEKTMDHDFWRKNDNLTLDFTARYGLKLIFERAIAPLCSFTYFINGRKEVIPTAILNHNGMVKYYMGLTESTIFCGLHQLHVHRSSLDCPWPHSIIFTAI